MKAKVYQYRNELRSIKKDARSVTEYHLRIKAIVDALTSIGTIVPEHEHIQCILEGLPVEYGPFITSINVRSGNVSVSELQALLISEEIKLEKHVVPKADSPTVNLAIQDSKDKSSQSNSSSHSSKPFQQSNTNPNTRFHGSNNRGGRSNFNPGRGRGRGGPRPPRGPRSNFVCQVCNRTGHLASYCYYRYDSNYFINDSQYMQNNPSFSGPRPSVNVASTIATLDLLADSA